MPTTETPENETENPANPTPPPTGPPTKSNEALNTDRDGLLTAKEKSTPEEVTTTSAVPASADAEIPLSTISTAASTPQSTTSAAATTPLSTATTAATTPVPTTTTDVQPLSTNTADVQPLSMNTAGVQSTDAKQEELRIAEAIPNEVIAVQPYIAPSNVE